MKSKLSNVLIVLSGMLTGCTVVNETAYIAGGIVTVKFENNKPKIRAATPFKECKWRFKGKLDDLSADQQLWLNCEVPTTMFNKTE